MRQIAIFLLVGAFCSGCAVSGGGTSGTGLDYDQQCPPDRPNCCPEETECVPSDS